MAELVDAWIYRLNPYVKSPKLGENPLIATLRIKGVLNNNG
jgi:hypothetical protein